MTKVKVELGKRYRDKILGTEGIATAVCRYIAGCEHVELSWLKDGDVKAVWVDVVRVVAIKEKSQVYPRLKPKDEQQVQRGGPGDHPPAQSMPYDQLT